MSGDETERAGVNAGGTGGVVPASTPLVSSGDGQTTRAAEFAVVETDRRRAALTPRLAVRLALVAIGFVVAGALGGFVVGASRQTVHGARVELMYKLREDRPAGFLRQDRQLTTQLVLIESRAVLLPVAEDAGMSFERLKRKVEASVVGDSEVLRIQVNDPSEDGARSLTQAVADRYLQIARDDPDLQERVLLERWLAELDQRRAQLEREAAEQERSRVSSTPAGSAPRPASAREAEVASELDSLLAERRDLIARHAALGVDAPEVKQVTDAYVLADPVAPKPLLTAAAGGAAALPIGLLLAAYLLRRRSIALTS